MVDMNSPIAEVVDADNPDLLTTTIFNDWIKVWITSGEGQRFNLKMVFQYVLLRPRYSFEYTDLDSHNPFALKNWNIWS